MSVRPASFPSRSFPSRSFPTAITATVFALGLASLPARAPAQDPATQVKAYAQTTPRMSTRIAWFSRRGSPGQLCIQYGQPVWKQEYDGMLDAAKGKTLRLGSDFWTSLDTSVDLTIGGVAVPAGQWYLGLACSDEGEWSLMVMDAAKVREVKGDGVMTSRMKAAIEAPLQYAATQQQVEKLTIELSDEKGQLGHGKLRLAWGKHELTAPIVADLKLDEAPAAPASEAPRSGPQQRPSERTPGKGSDERH